MATRPNPIEYMLETLLFASRWLLAPIYLGLAAAILLLLYAFGVELIHLFQDINNLSVNKIILGVLALIDLSLAGNLLIIVIFSGYENFVSKFSLNDHEDQPDWHGHVDFSTIKLKLMASVSAIAGIQLLKVFMEVEKYTDAQLKWMVIIFATFVGAGVLLALMDKIASETKEKKSTGAKIKTDA